MPVLVYLIRHGLTEWSQIGRHTSLTDIALTETGENEARRVGDRLSGIEFSEVISSPRLRAVRTCALAGITLKPRLDDDLREWEYGEYEGLRSPEILSLRPQWNIFRDGCPGGETAQQISERADGVVAKLKAGVGNVAVFSHGHFLRAVAIRWVALPIEAGARLYLNTGSISVLGFEHDRMDEPVIRLWNERP